LDFNKACENIVDSLPIGIVAFDNDLTIIKANQTASKLLCIQTENQIDRILKSGTDEDVWGNWERRLKEAIQQKDAGFLENVSFKAGTVEKLLEINCTSLMSEQEETIGGAITIEDITERVNIQKQLDNIERFAAVGKLAGKIAHELNNPMDGILRYINLTTRILEQEKLDKPIEYLSKCRTGLMRMVQIISELLEFSRSTYNTFEDVFIEDIIEDAIHSNEHKITAGDIEVVKDFDHTLPKIKCGNLYQVFCNLIKNSIDAMVDRGTLTITTKRADQNRVLIELKDTGPGIDPENLDSIFEPFFTTKKHGKGTGLGLAICKDIIEKYDGRITATNNPDKGSKFSVYLPLKNENSANDRQE